MLLTKPHKKDLTEANYKAAYDNYTPNTEVQVVSTTDKAVADKVDSEAKAEGSRLLTSC